MQGPDKTNSTFWNIGVFSNANHGSWYMLLQSTVEPIFNIVVFFGATVLQDTKLVVTSEKKSNVELNLN